MMTRVTSSGSPRSKTVKTEVKGLSHKQNLRGSLILLVTVSFVSVCIHVTGISLFSAFAKKDRIFLQIIFPGVFSNKKIFREAFPYLFSLNDGWKDRTHFIYVLFIRKTKVFTLAKGYSISFFFEIAKERYF